MIERVSPILLVDDDELVCDHLKLAVEDHNSRRANPIVLHCIQDSKRAFNFLIANCDNINLVVLDLEMPEINGWDFLEMMKANKSLCDIPVIFFTAHSVAEVQERAYQLGATACIQKQACIADIADRIGREARLHNLGRSLCKSSILERAVASIADDVLDRIGKASEARHDRRKTDKKKP